jgi:hypothetical protein
MVGSKGKLRSHVVHLRDTRASNPVHRAKTFMQKQDFQFPLRLSTPDGSWSFTLSILSHSLCLPPLLPFLSRQVLQLLAEVGVEDLLLATQENVSGDILVELNEEELETELGIRKKIPRLKIMKIINGSKPVTDYLKMSEPNSMDIVC